MRWSPASRSLLTLALLASCTPGQQTDSIAQAVTGGSPCDGVELDATRGYRPPSWTDGSLTFGAGSLTFAIPSSIPVTEGNAGFLTKTKLTFSTGGGTPTTCVYIGLGGRKYDLFGCRTGRLSRPDRDDFGWWPEPAPNPQPRSGSVVTADTFTLHINSGDPFAGPTEVKLVLAGPMISDDNLCTVDTCAADGTITHTPVDIDDGDDCTTDACDPSIGVTHTPVDSPVCRGKVDFHDTVLSGLGGNGRACSTCHVDSTAFQLTPANAEARYEAMLSTGVDDPLFRPIDANDFPTNGSAASDYTNLTQLGLVRIVLPLPPNVRLLDCGSQNPCPATAQPTDETTATVWRSTPSVFNVANTGPDGLAPAWPRGPNTNGGYQLDARQDTLQDQALGALHDHIQIANAPAQGFLDDVTAYEDSLLTVPPGTLTDLQAQGKAVFDRSCGQCHNGPGESTTLVTGRYVDIRTTYPRPVDPGVGNGPRWVFPAADQLAPLVRTYEFTFADGFKLRKTTTDPGRALLTGYVFSAAAPVPPAVCAHPPCGAATGDDFQKFDMPGLHGIANTAPYFHNNSAATLDDVLDQYDQLFLQLEATNPTSPVVTSMPGQTPPVFDRPLLRVDQDGGVERTALLAYLAIL